MSPPPPPRRRGRRSRLVAVALAALLPIAACGTGSTGDDRSGGTTTLTVYSGRSGQFNTTFNPFTPTTLTAARGMIYQTLLFWNRNKADVVKPMGAGRHQGTPGIPPHRGSPGPLT